VIRVLVVARSDLERAGLEALLAGRGHLAVGPGAVSLAEARRRIEDGSTDAVQVVLALTERGAEPPRLALAPDVAARGPALVLLAESPPRGWAVRAVRAGARAVLASTASGDAIAAAVEAAAAGLVVLPADALTDVPATRVGAAAAHRAPTESLSPREVQVLALLAEGLVNKQIAARLGISRHTVKTHLAALFHKLGVSTRAEAVVAGARAGMILL
jgi:DNA-binding NarL/FixJ family response regulator